MFCNSCGATNPDSSRFCNTCGKGMAGPSAAGAAPRAPAAPAASPAGAPAAESTLWEGRASPAAYLSHFLMLAGWWIAVGGFAVAVWPGMLGLARWWWVPTAAAGLPALYVAAIVGKDVLSHSYRLTTQRLFESIGIFLRQTRELELIRVKDTIVTQGLLERLSGAGEVTIYSTDSSDPVIHLERIKDPHAVKEKIRAAVQQRRSGTMYVEKM